MKTKLFLSMLLLAATMARGATADGNGGETNARIRTTKSVAIPMGQPAIENVPAGPETLAVDPQQELQYYDSAMMVVTQKFSDTLAAIADAVQRSEISSEQAKEMSVEQYQIAHMQFELLSFWRQIAEHDLATDAPASPEPAHDSEIVMVELPFSSLQLNSSLAEYLGLTSSQVDAIQQVMIREQDRREPLMTALRLAREKLLSLPGGPVDEKEVKALADAEASLLAKLIVANARMESRIYKILSPEQQKKLTDLQRMQAAVTVESR